MSVHSLASPRTSEPVDRATNSASSMPGLASHTPEPLQQLKVHLAAALRLAVLHELDEGIDNHFTVAVPGQRDRYLILPFGRHWSEARASDMAVFDEAGNTIEGSGVVELSARCIHAPIHRICGVQVVLHTHQTWALALNMLRDNRLLPTSQTSAFFDGRVAYDDHYTGLAHSVEEGERLAALLGDKHVLFMKNHGVLVVGNTVAQAYKRLYRLERVCRAQVLAMGSGQPLQVLSPEVVAHVQRPNPEDTHPSGERDRLYFEAMLRVLDRELPGYAD
jgi:ribulose-5-phosphate 4-epimerase/fuculose-1-phosphate aldolase